MKTKCLRRQSSFLDPERNVIQSKTEVQGVFVSCFLFIVHYYHWSNLQNFLPIVSKKSFLFSCKESIFSVKRLLWSNLDGHIEHTKIIESFLKQPSSKKLEWHLNGFFFSCTPVMWLSKSLFWNKDWQIKHKTIG